MNALSKLAQLAVKRGGQAVAKRAEKGAARRMEGLAVGRAPKALPSPPKRLALPAPDERSKTTYDAVSRSRYKPKGGQWLPPGNIGGVDGSPERAARAFRQMVLSEPSDALVQNLGLDAPSNAAGDWLEKALTRYVKRDMGTETDPVLSYLGRGVLPDYMDDPDRYIDTVSGMTLADPAAYYQGLDAGSDYPKFKASRFARDVANVAPWISKMPSTDPVYNMGQHEGLQRMFGHVGDEFLNALNPESGLPANLRLDEHTLQRMSFPQLVGRVADINDWRKAEMERAALADLSNPALHLYKEYPEDPRGLRWYEIKQPGEDAGDADARYEALARALRQEGDAMGHCVGGYCDDVASGASRIFSLRDAKGAPHVTIETSRGDQSAAYRDAIAELRGSPLWGDWLEHQRTADTRVSGGSLMSYMNAFRESKGLPRLDASIPDDIIQIKGKGNAKPVADYIPHVQDFVRSGSWGGIRDIQNADLARFGSEYLPIPERDDMLQSLRRSLLETPLGAARKKFYSGSNPYQYGTPEYEAVERVIGRPVAGTPYPIQDIMSVLEDPDAWGPDTVYDVVEAAKKFREQPEAMIRPPELPEGFARGGLAVKRDCGCGLKVRGR